MWNIFGNIKYFPYLCTLETKTVDIERNRR